MHLSLDFLDVWKQWWNMYCLCVEHIEEGFPATNIVFFLCTRCWPWWHFNARKQSAPRHLKTHHTENTENKPNIRFSSDPIRTNTSRQFAFILLVFSRHHLLPYCLTATHIWYTKKLSILYLMFSLPNKPYQITIKRCLRCCIPGRKNYS